MRFPIQLLWHVVLTILLLTSLLVSPSWQQQQHAPCLQAPRNNFSSRALIERAQNGAHLSPAVFLGTLRSVLVQRDGTVRAWFAVDKPLKMANGTSSRWVKGQRQDQEVVYYRTGSSCVLVLNQEQLKLGAQYLVYGAPLAGSRGSLTATALPIPNEKRTLRAVRRIVCKGCAKPPSIAGLTNVRVVEGGKTQLHCHLAGNPIPWVEWYKNGKKVVATRGRLRVRTKRRTSRLVVRRARASDRGLYECRAGNVVQREFASARATLIVTRKPRRTTRRPWSTSRLPTTSRLRTTSRPRTTLTPPLPYTASSLWTIEPCPNSNFCLNGGTCIFYKDVREYVCHCPDGFVGLRCHYKDVSISLGEMKNYSSREVIP